MPKISANIESYLKPLPQDRIEPLEKLQKMAWLLAKSTKWVNKKIMDGTFDAYLLDGDICVSIRSVNAYLEMCRITGQARKAADDEEDD